MFSVNDVFSAICYHYRQVIWKFERICVLRWKYRYLD